MMLFSCWFDFLYERVFWRMYRFGASKNICLYNACYISICGCMCSGGVGQSTTFCGFVLVLELYVVGLCGIEQNIV